MTTVDRIKQKIQAKGLKQEYVARHAGIAPSTFSQMLAGERKMYLEQFEAVCAVLNANPDELITPKNRAS